MTLARILFSTIAMAAVAFTFASSASAESITLTFSGQAGFIQDGNTPNAGAATIRMERTDSGMAVTIRNQSPTTLGDVANNARITGFGLNFDNLSSLDSAELSFNAFTDKANTQSADLLTGAKPWSAEEGAKLDGGGPFDLVVSADKGAGGALFNPEISGDATNGYYTEAVFEISDLGDFDFLDPESYLFDFEEGYGSANAFIRMQGLGDGGSLKLYVSDVEYDDDDDDPNDNDEPDDGDDPTPAPEPASLVLFGLLGSLGLYGGRKLSKKA